MSGIALERNTLTSQSRNPETQRPLQASVKPLFLAAKPQTQEPEAQTLSQKALSTPPSAPRKNP